MFHYFTHVLCVWCKINSNWYFVDRTIMCSQRKSFVLHRVNHLPTAHILCCLLLKNLNRKFFIFLKLIQIYFLNSFSPQTFIHLCCINWTEIIMSTTKYVMPNNALVVKQFGTLKICWSYLIHDAVFMVISGPIRHILNKHWRILSIVLWLCFEWDLHLFWSL